jgi:hypothetical protein
MSLYLYGIIPEEKKTEFGQIGIYGDSVYTVACQAYSAVVGSSSMENFSGLRKEELVKLLLHHQKTLETITKDFFVLPFKFGTIIEGEAPLKRAMDGGMPLVKKICDHIKGCTEIDVIATWDVKKMLQEVVATDPEIRACKSDAEKGLKESRVVGMLLADALKRKSTTWCQRIVDSLITCTLAHADHDLMNDEMVCNASFLIQKKNEDEFFKKVEEVDRIFAGRLNLKCVGPLPPYSFATLTLKTFDAAEVRKAADLLGMGASAEVNEVKRTYKKLSAKVHPDTRPDMDTDDFDHLNKAYGLIADYVKEGRRFFNAEAVSTYTRLECKAFERIP